ncbi:MAG TPA: cytochrome c oxidase subunit 3, partial [Casimicrobiaceae bacterium]|nr:cytochrome c oxidase subunit 3 [Casimicrobiaceae bacterium]
MAQTRAAAIANATGGQTPIRLAAHFDDADQQRAAATLGMWVFLTTETLFFGALFFAYTIARSAYPDAFAAASRHTSVILGTTNTAILLTSSLFMALAVRAAAMRAHRLAAAMLMVTAVLGLSFAGIKLTEYALEYREHLVPVVDFAFAPDLFRGAELFFWIYFTSTGLHLVHLLIGIALVSLFAWRAYRAEVVNLAT